jgi:hypothetical protein
LPDAIERSDRATFDAVRVADDRLPVNNNWVENQSGYRTGLQEPALRRITSLGQAS